VSDWVVRLFGRARATNESAQEFELERKAAACIARLAAEGPTARSELADLLWPDAGPDAQRANLRQLARRLKVALGHEIVTGADPVALDLAVHVDLCQFYAWSAASDWRNLTSVRGQLLSGMYFADCPGLDEWLSLTRTRIEWTIAHALNVASTDAEQHEGPEVAIPIVLQWLELDPSSEEAYRRLMRIHYTRGERGAALAVYETCKTTLKQRLDAEPGEATRALAKQIRGSASGTTPAVRQSRNDIPLTVLRPPVLAGRAAAWISLHDATERGKLVFVTGDAGMGKTRLVQDFAAQNPQYETRYVACRPTDRDLPYSYFARTWRHDLSAFPERVHTLAPWVRHEIARILPELGDPPPPIATAEERTRFFDANVEMAKANDGSLIVLTDDAHHLDAASHELGIYLAMCLISESTLLRSVSTYRFDELEEEPRTLIEALCASGEAVLVELQPLSEDEVRLVLEAMEVGSVAKHTDALHAFTGGNPFFLVETIKALFDGSSARTLPDALTPSERVRLTIERRLGRLPDLALALLRAAAILDEPLRFSLAASMLNVSVEQIGPAWAELERLLLLRGGTVVHELLRTVVLDSMPYATRTLLHRRAASALQTRTAHPGRIALHWERAEEWEQAVRAYLDAADLSRRMLREAEARRFEALAEVLASRIAK
jgi:DNA-binding SARP family transcriptional activator